MSLIRRQNTWVEEDQRDACLLPLMKGACCLSLASCSFLANLCLQSLTLYQCPASKKQGACGKIKVVHQESKLSCQLCHLDEVMAAISLLYINPLESNLQSHYVRKAFNADDLSFCDENLDLVPYITRRSISSSQRDPRRNDEELGPGRESKAHSVFSSCSFRVELGKLSHLQLSSLVIGRVW